MCSAGCARVSRSPVLARGVLDQAQQSHGPAIPSACCPLSPFSPCPPPPPRDVQHHWRFVGCVRGPSAWGLNRRSNRGSEKGVRRRERGCSEIRCQIRPRKARIWTILGARRTLLMQGSRTLWFQVDPVPDVRPSPSSSERVLVVASICIVNLRLLHGLYVAPSWLVAPSCLP